MFDYNSHSVLAEGWCPASAISKVKNSLRAAKETSESSVPISLIELQSDETPPSYFETNKFTACFQDIVNAYGVPRYKEVNPAVLTIITFPFFFAVMYGDLGHGIIFTLGSLLLVLFEKKLEKTMMSNELLSMLFYGRYCLLLMGIFSIYTGWLYNECFGVVLETFPSGWMWKSDGTARFSGKTYEFGIDPAWGIAQNKLNYYNSIKMKMSVLFGVGQVRIFLKIAINRNLDAFRISVGILESPAF